MLTYVLFALLILPAVYWKTRSKGWLTSLSSKSLLIALLYGLVCACIMLLYEVAAISAGKVLNSVMPVPNVVGVTVKVVFKVIPTQLLLFFALYLLQKRFRVFSKPFDCIVYSVYISLGLFMARLAVRVAAVNFQEAPFIVSTVLNAATYINLLVFLGIAVLMGYNYSKYHYGTDDSARAKLNVLALPVLAQFVGDMILSGIGVTGFAGDIISLVLLPLSIVYLIALYVVCDKKIKELKS